MVSFEKSAFEEYREWSVEDKKIFAKINDLITEIMRDPFHGTGKPEPLKGNLSGYWSRRITQEHRLVYTVSSNHIIISSCKYHY
ncbi:toxin YoeB [Spirochaetia bacterium]|nr:toxin YoeB [Spirochaetia bacterium]